MNQRKGFTLIELMVVMAIIGILAGLVLTSFSTARKTTRDGRRKADLEQIRSALEMCYADTNAYPLTGEIDAIVFCGGKTYLSPTPSDPATGDNYYYSSDGTTYTLCAKLEASSPHDCGDYNYKVTNP